MMSELEALYREVMHPDDLDFASGTFTVRLWDGMINDLLITETDASEFLRVDIKHEAELKELEDDIESKRTSAA